MGLYIDPGSVIYKLPYQKSHPKKSKTHFIHSHVPHNKCAASLFPKLGHTRLRVSESPLVVSSKLDMLFYRPDVSPEEKNVLFVLPTPPSTAPCL